MAGDALPVVDRRGGRRPAGRGVRNVATNLARLIALRPTAGVTDGVDVQQVTDIGPCRHQRQAVGPEEAAGDGRDEQGQERVAEAGHVQQAVRLGVQAQLRPHQHLPCVACRYNRKANDAGAIANKQAATIDCDGILLLGKRSCITYSHMRK